MGRRIPPPDWDAILQSLPPSLRQGKPFTPPKAEQWFRHQYTRESTANQIERHKAARTPGNTQSFFPRLLIEPACFERLYS